MNLARLQRSDVLAVLPGLVLLVVMAVDWYSTVDADEARRVQELAQPEGALAGEVERRVDEDAEIVGEQGERNAWQEDGAIDRVILVSLLLAYALALLSAFLRAAGRRVEPPFTPAAMGAIAAAVGALLLAYRMWQEPREDAFNTIRPGAPLAIALLGLLALALATAYRGEESGRAWERMERADAPVPDPPPATT